MSAVTCGSCAYVHESTWARAVGRFDQETVNTYRAEYLGSPTRHSRKEAEQDMCNRKAGQQ